MQEAVKRLLMVRRKLCLHSAEFYCILSASTKQQKIEVRSRRRAK